MDEYFVYRGGFGRGGIPQGPTRGEFRNEPVNTVEKTPPPSQEPEEKEKDSNVAKPRSDRWSHDGYDQMMKVQDKGYRNSRNDSRPRSVQSKVHMEEILMFGGTNMYRMTRSLIWTNIQLT